MYETSRGLRAISLHSVAHFYQCSSSESDILVERPLVMFSAAAQNLL